MRPVIYFYGVFFMFKKLFALLLCLVMCVGCGGKTEIKAKNISFEFAFQSGNEEFLLEARVNDTGDMEFTVLKPENIDGFKAVFSGNTVNMHFLNVEKSVPFFTDEFGIPGHIYTAFSLLESAEASRQSDEYKAEVSSNGNEYIFTFTELGLPISLSVNGEKIEFNNIKTS